MKHAVRLPLLAVVTLVSAAAALASVPARAGDDVTEARAVAPFERIRFEGFFDATVSSGARAPRVTLTAPRDTLAVVTTTVRDGTLVLGTRPGAEQQHVVKIAVDVPVLRGVEATGVGHAGISGLHGGDFAITDSGAMTIDAAGRAENLTVTLDGVGKIDTTALDARDATVDNNGVGSVRVRAAGTLALTVNGVGEIRYAGNPAHVASHVNGVGSISPL
jgi:hypothetical protein